MWLNWTTCQKCGATICIDFHTVEHQVTKIFPLIHFGAFRQKNRELQLCSSAWNWRADDVFTVGSIILIYQVLFSARRKQNVQTLSDLKWHNNMAHHSKRIFPLVIPCLLCLVTPAHFSVARLSIYRRAQIAPFWAEPLQQKNGLQVVNAWEWEGSETEAGIRALTGGFLQGMYCLYNSFWQSAVNISCGHYSKGS